MNNPPRHHAPQSHSRIPMTRPGCSCAPPPEGAPPLNGQPLPLEFVNTVHPVRGVMRDGFASPELVAWWLSACRSAFRTDLPDEELARVTAADAHCFALLRDSARRLHRGPRPPTGSRALGRGADQPCLRTRRPVVSPAVGGGWAAVPLAVRYPAHRRRPVGDRPGRDRHADRLLRHGTDPLRGPRLRLLLRCEPLPTPVVLVRLRQSRPRRPALRPAPCPLLRPVLRSLTPHVARGH